MCLRLLHDYDARTRIVYVEVSEEILHARNGARERAPRVPETVLARLLGAWDVPDRSEADAVDYVIS